LEKILQKSLQHPKLIYTIPLSLGHELLQKQFKQKLDFKNSIFHTGELA